MTRMQAHSRRTIGLGSPSGAMTSVGLQSDSMKLERRQGVRLPTSGGLLATWRDGRGRMGLVTMELIDVSDGGLGVSSPRGITIGARLTLRERNEQGAWGEAVVMRRRREGPGVEAGAADRVGTGGVTPTIYDAGADLNRASAVR